MSYARLRAEILAAREAREAALAGLPALQGLVTDPTLVFASTAIPGPRKTLPGGDALLRRAVAELERRLGRLRILRQGRDVLGPWLIAAAAADAAGVKKICIGIEDRHPAARLVDLDVYAAGGRRLGRADLGRPPRRCLLCDQPAADCIRRQSHPPAALAARAEALLADVRHPAAG